MENNFEDILEGMLFLSGSNGVTFAEIILTLNIDEGHAKELLANLKEKYEKSGGLELIHTTNSFKLVTKPEFYEFHKKYVNLNNDRKISNSSLEVLAIIAYKQPITKFEIDELKGVNTNYHLTLLLEKELIYVSGRKKEIGSPNLFSTTEKFLDFIGINEISDLPDLRTFIINTENNSLLNFEEFDFKSLSEQLLNPDNTIEVKQLDQNILDQIDEIQDIEINKDIFDLEKEEESE